MPRLTTREYLRTHDKLRRLWLRDPSLFAELSPTDQWLLHDFFKPDRDLTDLELLQHRDDVTQQRPSLPHQAGRALNRFWDATAQLAVKRVTRAKAPAAPAKRVRQADRHLVVKALVKPELDAKKLARAFVWLAQQRLREQQSEQGKPSDDMAA